MTDFKVLTDREHVLQRSGVYIGSTTCEPMSSIINYQYCTKNVVPALIKCVEEIYQNSIDEHIRTGGEFAKNIDISIMDTLEGAEIIVTDDGRGIPLDKINDSYRPVLAWTELRAGSNFDDTKRVGAGTNGMGAALVNIFSTSFIGTTCDGKNKLTLTCSDNMQNIKHVVAKSKERGTTVAFVPDLPKFGLTDFDNDHHDVIQDRIINLAILYPTINFTLNGYKVSIKNLKQVAKNFHVAAIPYEQEKIGFVFAPSGNDEEFRCLSYVNGIYVKNGGAHVDFVMNKVIENLRAAIKKKHKIDVLPNQIRQHMLFASWVQGFPALRFDSQSKERVTNSVAEISSYFGDIDFDKISKQILGTPEIIDPMIASILYKIEMAEKLALAKKQKATAKTRIVDHIAATDPDPEKRMLLICEGNSAIGSLISVRDAKSIGGYPIRGKLKNVRDMKPIDIMKNKEIVELLAVIGLEIGKPAINLNYGKICVFTDRDLDGEHIFALLLNLFSLWHELFEDRRIYRMLSPLYYCTKGKQVKSFYDKDAFDHFDSKGWVVEYFKGLGSMPEEVYSDCVNNPQLEQIVADDLDKLEMAFGDNAERRKIWMIG
jgi:DNA gyrase/topoisomerase IV subunit B